MFELDENQSRQGSRKQHLGAVFEAVLTRGPLSRKDAARVTGLSAASVTKLVKPMISHGYLVEREREAGAPGRPQIPLQVDPARHYAIGIKVMGSELVGVLADLHAEVQASQRLRYDDSSPEGVVDATARIADMLLERRPDSRARLLGVGIALGGHVDGVAGVAVQAPFLGWRNVPLQQMVAERLGVDVVLENDVNALAVAEQWFGPGFAFPSFALVTLGVGVGCALVIDGHLWRGVSGAAGELGHMVLSPEGPECHCGKRGCLEAVVGDEALVAAASARSGLRLTTVAHAAAAAHAGNEEVRSVFTEAGAAVGRAIAAVVNLLNPPAIILSGEGLAASDLYMDALRSELARDAFSTTAKDCQLLVRPLPDETWARGAAATMLRAGVLRSLSRLSDQVVG